MGNVIVKYEYFLTFLRPQKILKLVRAGHFELQNIMKLIRGSYIEFW